MTRKTASQNPFIVSMDGQDSSKNTSSTRPDPANATAHKPAYASYRLKTLVLRIDTRQRLIAQLQKEIDRIAQGGGYRLFELVIDPDGPGEDDWEYDWDDSGPYSKESVMLEYQQKLDKWKQKLKEYKQEYEDLVV